MINIKTNKLLSNLGIFFISASSLITTNAYGQTSTNNANTIKSVLLSDEPLHSSGTTDKPTITLALSVEFPTIGALYRDKQGTEFDATYSPNTEFIGYFYSKGCYKYVNDPTGNGINSSNKNNYKRFQFTKESSTRECNDDNEFSGNFLNWAASSSIDILRLALSGGDRFIDHDGFTVLQRAIVPAGTPKMACLWNNKSFFPAKKLFNSQFKGAIPKDLADRAGATADLWIANRHDGIYFNNVKPTMTDWEDKINGCDIESSVNNYKNFLTKNNGTITEGFYYARVEVCTKVNNTVQDHLDFGLCTQQPNGNYKPTGVIQKHANNLRIAAFSYALDHTKSHWNPVLRAPMRYVGAKSFDIYGREEIGSNPYAEWDSYTGILKQNPYESLDKNIASWPSQGPKNSGVINYLNTFGRTAAKPATDTVTISETSSTTHHYGEYKWNDTVSSLYYHSLRYLQGLEYYSDPNKSFNDKNHDGFPIYKNWTDLDPFGSKRSNAEDYACLKNNIVMIGDKNAQEVGTWQTFSQDDKTRREISYSTWRDKARTFNSKSFGTDAQYNLVGYAYWAHANDIRGEDWTEKPSKQRPGLRIKSFFFDVNEKSESSDANTRKSTNQFFLAAKFGGYETDPRNDQENYYSTDDKPNEGLDPKKPGSTEKITSDSIWQRRPVGERDLVTTKHYEAATYYLQSDARSVLSAFDDIFNRAASGAQSISQTSSSTSSINATTDSHIYTGTYDMSSWTGDVISKKIVIDKPSNNVTLVEDENFKPASLLNLRSHTSRNIIIGPDGIGNGYDFKWSDLPAKFKEFLNKESPGSTNTDAHGEKRLNFIRGDQSLEGQRLGTLEVRTRKSILGDIINAGVSYSGAPSSKFNDKSYKKFKELHANRLPIVVSGSNDGMLHAFATEDKDGVNKGDEVFAYIPSWISQNLTALVDAEYPENHRAFVDSPSTVADAQIKFSPGEGDASDWKTVLVSGTGAGGRGIFALDITNPASFSKNHVIWEFTSSHDPDMGYIVSKPKVLKFKTDVDTYRWFVVVGSGVNNYSSDFDSNGGSGSPAIFLLALDKPLNEKWELEKNYYKISLPVNTELAKSKAPGITDFSMLWSLDNAVTHIYAGDLHGNLWKFDFTDISTTSKSKVKPPSEWNANSLSSFKKGEPATAYPLYKAQFTNSNNLTTVQPITAPPILIQGPIVEGIETFYVAFGTGKYLEPFDVGDNTQQSFYVIYDNNSIKADSSDPARESAITPGTSRLQKATIDSSSNKITVPNFVWGRPNSAKEAIDKKSGWYFDFPSNAERMIYSGADLGNFNITFNSVIPGIQQSTPSICTVDNATSNSYNLNIRTGGGNYRKSQIGILGPSLFLENEEKEETTLFDSTGRAKRTVVNEEIASGTTGHSVRSINSSETVGRLSWRQIFNYKELRQKSSN